jgi:hypothetical protein
MFRCQLCQSVVPPRTPCHRLALARRRKAYPFRARANALVRTSETGKRKAYHTDDPGGQGQEVVQEVSVCPACAARNGRN